jgi:phosphopantothenoylcysteine decarboxylase/phosphopantothenate--cysteine ligase
MKKEKEKGGKVMGKTVILGVTGGIAAYKSPSLASQLRQRGYNTQAVVTKSALEFTTRVSLQAMSGNYVLMNTFEETNPSVINHIDLADKADLIVIAPATANFIAKLANGLADDMLSNILLAAKCKVLICPAMNVNMYHHPLTYKNIQTLKELCGYEFLDPETGHLACGYEAEGKLPSIKEIVDKIDSLLKTPKERE